MTPLELLLCAILVALSGYLSASEIALFSLSRFQLRSLRERFKSSHRKIKKLLGDPSGLLVTLLVLNEVLNIALSTLITGSISQHHAELPFGFLSHVSPWAVDTLLGIVITAPIILFFCEITPKVVGARANKLVATLTIKPLELIYYVMKPVRKVLKKLTDLAARLTGAPPTADSEVLKESDFLLMLEEGHKEGAIHENELELIKKVFEFDDTTVARVFTPLTQVQSLAITTNLRGALATIRAQKYSRIPIIASNRRQVVGVLYSKDLLRAKLDPERMQMSVAEVMRKPLVVSPSLRLNALFRKFKQQKTHMAVVQNTAGDALGVITMSDILDTLFEDLFPDEDSS